MSVVGIATEKGGVGKSTLTQSIAALRASLNYSVAVLDLDYQQTTSKWGSRRAELADVAKIHIERLPDGERRNHVVDYGQALERLAAEYDTVFVEAGGKDTKLFRAALATCDKVIVPLVPSPADLDTAGDLAELVRALPKKPDISVVLNMASGMPRMVREMREGLDTLKDVLPTFPNVLGNRVAFKYAMMIGKGVSELTSKEGADVAASNELKDFYLGVFSK